MPALYFENKKIGSNEQDAMFFEKLGASREIQDLSTFKSAKNLIPFYWRDDTGRLIMVLGDESGEEIFKKYGGTIGIPPELTPDKPKKRLERKKLNV